MFRILALSFFLFQFASPANANEFRLTPMVGDVLTYEITVFSGDRNNETQEKQYEVTKRYTGLDGAGNHVFELSTGGTETFNAFGAKVSDPKFEYRKLDEPLHDGSTSANMDVGTKWEHRYDRFYHAGRHDSTWTRTCVVKSKDRETKVGVFKTLIKCENQKINVFYPAHERRWVDLETGYRVHEVRFWEGSNPGRVTERLVEMKLMPRRQLSQKQ